MDGFETALWKMPERGEGRLWNVVRGQASFLQAPSAENRAEGWNVVPYDYAVLWRRAAGLGLSDAGETLRKRSRIRR